MKKNREYKTTDDGIPYELVKQFDGTHIVWMRHATEDRDVSGRGRDEDTALAGAREKRTAVAVSEEATA